MASTTYKNVYISDYYTVAGLFEGRGAINNYDFILKDHYFGEKTFEKTEQKIQKKILDELLGRNTVDLIIGGDLTNQLSSCNYPLMKVDLPFIGLYSACATFVGSLIISGTFLEAKKANKSLVITSAHNSNCEKQFRFPIEYGSPKPKRSTFTTTGGVGCIVTNNKTRIKIESSTIGKVKDSYIKDVNNMGAVMALGAADTIINHLKDLKRNVSYYDLVLTGDLGIVGKKILKEVLSKQNIKLKNYEDSGTLLYKENQNTCSGGSGPAVLPLVLFSKIINNNKYKKILIVGTGSLHSLVMVNQKCTIPTISHVVSLEVE